MRMKTEPKFDSPADPWHSALYPFRFGVRFAPAERKLGNNRPFRPPL